MCPRRPARRREDIAATDHHGDLPRADDLRNLGDDAIDASRLIPYVIATALAEA
jgi:hypothetical protein